MRTALDGSFTTHHTSLVTLHLNRIDLLDQHISEISDMIEALITDNDLAGARELLATITWDHTTGAENIIAETGIDMTIFQTTSHLASWAGVCPGQHESAGRSGSGRVRPGNAHQKGALGIAAMTAVRTKGSFFQGRYRRLVARRGGSRALAAIEHSMLTAIWHILTNHESYREHRPQAA